MSNLFLRLTLAAVPATWFIFGPPGGAAAQGYHPDHPMVLAMVERGVRGLESQVNGSPHFPMSQVFRGGHGELALNGYAHFKVQHDANNPVVERGLEAARFIAANLDPDQTDGVGGLSKTFYAVSVAALLLAEVDPVAYERELAQISNYLRRSQRNNGSYGYPDFETGDVSQCQYVALAFWTLDRKGVPVDYATVGDLGNWMMRAQDPAGGWPYHAIVGSGGQDSPQRWFKVTPSMALAGGSTVLIAADTQRVFGEVFAGLNSPNIEGLPKAVQLYVERQSDPLKNQERRKSMSAQRAASSVENCQSWLQANSVIPTGDGSSYPYYQLYTLERYEAFREAIFKLPKDDSPTWYNEGVDYLRKRQDANTGLWPKTDHGTGSVSTSFALLFLIRGTQKGIAATERGTTAGGYELPPDTTNIEVEGTQIKGKSVEVAVDDLLDTLEENVGGDLEGKSIPEDLKLADDPKTRRRQLDRMERLLRGSLSWQARRVAARLVGQSDEHRVVPTLIYALSDPDSHVKRYARDGLRFISRKFEGFGMPDDPTDSEIEQAQREWLEWYRSTNPGFVSLQLNM